jgi:gamma-glutamyl-gamma-aminobutyrate hydrolase PuuD
MFIANDWDIVNDVDDAEYIQFTGGADVSPMLYNEPKHPRTYNDPRRDDAESNLYWTYVGSKKMLGICRGGQFLNVMNGGSMVQDVNNHAIGGTHPATILDTGRIVQVTSTHHQMIWPNFESGVVLVDACLATKKEGGYGSVHSDYTNIVGDDVEVVLYNDTNSLCFQPHPEYVEPKHECQRLYFNLIDQCLKG